MAAHEGEKKRGTTAEFGEENRGGRARMRGRGGGELNRRRRANIAVQRDEGEPRCR